MKDERDLRQLRPGRAARHRRARRARSRRASSAAPASTTSSASTCPPDHPLCAMANVVLTPHIGGATYDTEANHSRLDRRRPRAACSTAGDRRNLVNPEVLRDRAVAHRAGDQGAGALGRQGDAAQRARRGTAGNLGARLPDGNAVLTPSSASTTPTMTLDDLVVCDLDGNVLEGERSPTTEKALHLGALELHDDIHATMHCHAKFATMFALTRQGDPGRDRGVRRLHRRRRRVRRLPTTGTDELGRGGREAGRPTARGADGQPRAVRGGQEPEAGAAHRAPRRAHRGDRLGRACLGEIVPIPDGVNEQFQGYYRYGRTGKF